MLFEAIEARDKDAARATMRRHIENTCKRVFDGSGGGREPTPVADAIGRVCRFGGDRTGTMC